MQSAELDGSDSSYMVLVRMLSAAGICKKSVKGNLINGYI